MTNLNLSIINYFLLYNYHVVTTTKSIQEENRNKIKKINIRSEKEQKKVDKFSIYFITGVEFIDLTVYFAIILTCCMYAPKS